MKTLIVVALTLCPLYALFMWSLCVAAGNADRMKGHK